MKGWLTDLRKTALLAAIGMIVGIVLGAPLIAEQFSRAINGLNHPSHMVLAFIFGFATIVGLPLIAVPIGFLFSLYRTKMAVRIPDRLRVLAWSASAITICLAIWSRQFYFGRSGLAYLKQPEAFARFVVGIIEDLISVAFLISLARHSEDADIRSSPDDRLLRRLARTGTIIWGIALVGILWATAYTAYYYRSMQHQYFRNLEDFVPLSKLMWEKVHQFLQQAIIFVPFFVIHRGFVERWRLTAEASVPAANGFDTPESPADQA